MFCKNSHGGGEGGGNSGFPKVEISKLQIGAVFFEINNRDRWTVTGKPPLRNAASDFFTLIFTQDSAPLLIAGEIQSLVTGN